MSVKINKVVRKKINSIWKNYIWLLKIYGPKRNKEKNTYE